MPAGRGQRAGGQRPAGRARALLRGRLLGPPRLEGHVFQARLDGAPIRLRAGDGRRRRLYASGGGQRPRRGRRPRAGRLGLPHAAAAIAARAAPASPFRAGRSRSGRAGRRLGGRMSGSRATFPAPSRSRSRAARTPATRCLSRTSCAKWSSWANGGAKRLPSPHPRGAIPALPRRRSYRRAEQGRSWRRRRGEVGLQAAVAHSGERGNPERRRKSGCPLPRA